MDTTGERESLFCLHYESAGSASAQETQAYIHEKIKQKTLIKTVIWEGRGQQKKLKVFADNESKTIREIVSKLTTTKSTE